MNSFHFSFILRKKQIFRWIFLARTDCKWSSLCCCFEFECMDKALVVGHPSGLPVAVGYIDGKLNNWKVKSWVCLLIGEVVGNSLEFHYPWSLSGVICLWRLILHSMVCVCVCVCVHIWRRACTRGRCLYYAAENGISWCKLFLSPSYMTHQSVAVSVSNCFHWVGV